MITGYNTDVRYNDLVLHVQTEDKGRSNPYIESLIYFGGQVVAAKRASYSDLLAGADGSSAITALMDQQHRHMVRAIQAGKFDDKIQRFIPDSPKEITAEVDRREVFELADGDRTLDQVILEYLTNEAEQEQLVLVLEEEVELRAGRSAALALRTRSSKTGGSISGSKVQVKLISTFGGPHTLASGQTDGDGFLRLRVDIPEIERGTAALIISAAAEAGRAEIKHLL